MLQEKNITVAANKQEQKLAILQNMQKKYSANTKRQEIPSNCKTNTANSLHMPLKGWLIRDKYNLSWINTSSHFTTPLFYYCIL